MTVHRIYHCKGIRGTGPEWVDVDIEVFMDDIEPWVEEWRVDDMCLADCREQLKRKGYFQHRINDWESI